MKKWAGTVAVEGVPIDLNNVEIKPGFLAQRTRDAEENLASFGMNKLEVCLDYSPRRMRISSAAACGRRAPRRETK
jgi:hypothetical protein